MNMTYDPTFNRLTSLRDARGNTTQYSYDNQGNLLDITYPDNTVHQFSYDPMGTWPSRSTRMATRSPTATMRRAS